MRGEKLTAHLEKAILQGVYRAGAKFPSERELAEKYNVSRNTVREAIARLAHLGLLKTVPQSGTYVTDYHTSASLDLLVRLMQTQSLLEQDTLESILEFRRLVTVFAVRKAAQRMDPEQIKELQNLTAREKRHIEQGKIVADCDFQLHSRIFAWADNLALQLVFNSCKSLYRLHTDVFFTLPEAAEVTVSQHERLISALAAGDGDGAAEIMEEALLYGEKRILEVVAAGTALPLAKNIGRD